MRALRELAEREVGRDRDLVRHQPIRIRRRAAREPDRHCERGHRRVTCTVTAMSVVSGSGTRARSTW